MVSEPLLWPFLSSLVFISVTPFFFPHHFHNHNNRRSLLPLNLRCHPTIVLGFRTCSRRCKGVSHCTNHCRLHHRYKHCSNYGFEGTTEIVLRRSTKPWKPQHLQRPHAPPRVAQSFCTVDHAFHAPSCASRLLHSPPRTSTCQFSPADVSPRWRHHCHVICWRHPPVSWRHHWPGRWPDRWLFSMVDFFSPGSSYPIFT